MDHSSSPRGARRAHRGRRLRAATIGAALVLTTLAAVPSAPAGAAATDSDTLVFVPYNGQTFGISRNGALATPAYTTTEQPLEGDFTGGAGTDVFLYTPGSAPDGIVTVAPTGTTATTSFIPKSVNGTYQPLVGDFDGNGISDIFWYAPGSSPDSVWLFSSSGAHTSKSMTVNGDYLPEVFEANGDGYDDIIWYRPGKGADSIWRFGAGATYTSKPVTINGSYQLIAGTFGVRPAGSPQKRLLFWSAVGPDSIWTFDTSANHTSAPAPNVNGAYYPVVGRFTDLVTDAVLFYRPGAPGEALWDFTDAGAVNQLEPPQVYGDYDWPAAVGDLDGNGYQDIAWSSAGKAQVWKFNGGGYSVQVVNSNLPNTYPVVAYTDPADLDSEAYFY